MTNLSGTNLNNGAAVGPQGEGMDSPSNFPKYPAYKDSGVEWLGLVPEHWVVTRLGRVTEIESGYPFPAEQFVDDGIPVVRMSDLKEGQVSLDSIKRVEARFVPVKAMAKADDLLIGLSGSISNFAQVSASDLPLAVNQRVGIIRADDSIEATIAKYFVISKSFICQIESAVPETTILNISMEQVRSCALAWPPRFEQTQIARFLDHETARIDALIEEQQRLIELLKEKRQAVISHAVTKGLDPTVPMKDSGVEWLGEVPAHWIVRKVSIDFQASKGPRGALLTKEYCHENPGEYPVYSGQTENGGVLGEIADYDFDLGAEGAILSTTVGAKAMSVMHVSGRISLSQNCMIIRPLSSDVKVGFYFYHLQPLFSLERRMIPDHMQPSFRMEDLYSFRVAVPPVGEQNQIADYLDSTVSRFDELIGEGVNGINLLLERRSALISAAVTGKIDVRNWQPPAGHYPVGDTQNRTEPEAV